MVSSDGLFWLVVCYLGVINYFAHFFDQWYVYVADMVEVGSDNFSIFVPRASMADSVDKICVDVPIFVDTIFVGVVFYNANVVVSM